MTRTAVLTIQTRMRMIVLPGRRPHHQFRPKYHISRSSLYLNLQYTLQPLLYLLLHLYRLDTVSRLQASPPSKVSAGNSV